MGKYSCSGEEESSDDNESSSVPESSRSWMSNVSLGMSEAAAATKPHKANEAAWEAVRRLRRAAGTVGLEHFRLLKRVGSGDIGNVYVCQIRGSKSSSCLYALKVVDREALAARKKLHRAEMEKDILTMLDHPFLPTLYAHFHASHYSCLLIDYCPNGDLYAARHRRPSNRFPISYAKFYAAETVVALEYLHMMGIVYRDLKPENVLVREDGHIMLSDFDLSFKCDVVPKILRRSTEEDDGLRHENDSPPPPLCSTPSCFSSSSRRYAAERRDVVAEPMNGRSKSFVGTHEYLAPEVISGQGHGGAVDWWTLGVFLYEMLYGVTPFKGENNDRTLGNILKKPLNFPSLGNLTPYDLEQFKLAQDLMSKLLVKNPKKRMGSVMGSAEIKRHPFFKGLNWALIRSVSPPHPHGLNTNSSSRPKLVMMGKKEKRDSPFQIPSSTSAHHFDYF